MATTHVPKSLVHDHDTVTIPVRALTDEHTLVGESGGLSSIYEVTGRVLGSIAVTTEHGVLYLDADGDVEVLA